MLSGPLLINMTRRNMIVRRLSVSGAISESTALTFQEAGIPNPDAFPKVTESLERQKVIVKTKNEKYYLGR